MANMNIDGACEDTNNMKVYDTLVYDKVPIVYLKNSSTIENIAMINHVIERNGSVYQINTNPNIIHGYDLVKSEENDGLFSSLTGVCQIQDTSRYTFFKRIYLGENGQKQEEIINDYNEFVDIFKKYVNL